jgi:protein-disulfide isomerase
LSAPKTKQKLEAQIAEAQQLGVQATPTLFVNGKKLPRINDFIQVVDKEAQARGFPPMQKGPSP